MESGFYTQIKFNIFIFISVKKVIKRVKFKIYLQYRIIIVGHPLKNRTH